MTPNQSLSPLLLLPAELRLQIYELVLPRRVVFVRMKWTGICAPTGFQYSCLEDTQPLLASHESKILSHAVPFGPELCQLSQTCQLIHREAACLPFEKFIWAFETAFTLDQWVAMKNSIPLEHKNAIRTVAVPMPGPYRASERVLLKLDQVYLIGKAHATTKYFDQPTNATNSVNAIITLKKDKETNTWNRSGECAQYAKDLFE